VNQNCNRKAHVGWKHRKGREKEVEQKSGEGKIKRREGKQRK